MKVLVVEDSAEEREMIVRGLELAGYTAVPCASVDDTHKLLDETDQHFDLVVLDLLLSGDFEAAFGIISKVRRSRLNAHVVILSAHGCANHAVRAIKAGAFDFVDKPQNLRYTPAGLSSTLVPKLAAALQSTRFSHFQERLDLLSRLSEDSLIDLILIPLFKEMGFLAVERTAFHGPSEGGKDILPFHKYGDFNERIHYAAQVKAGSITATSGSSASAQTLLHQANTALRSSFVDRFDNVRKHLDRFLVICSGTIGNEARRIIEEGIEDKRDLLFLDGSDILDLLSQNGLLLNFDRRMEELQLPRAGRDRTAKGRTGS
jgi:ActR/RegA family two-component response regulator